MRGRDHTQILEESSGHSAVVFHGSDRGLSNPYSQHRTDVCSREDGTSRNRTTSELLPSEHGYTPSSQRGSYRTEVIGPQGR